MTVKELKEKLENLPDEMIVGGSGHFGEYLECYDAEVRQVFESPSEFTTREIFCISLENAGNEPD
jgi:hypothetical protein